MAEKEAILFVVDLGLTMADCNSGRSQSDLDWAMQWVWDKITTVIAASRKTLCVGVLGLRTDATGHLMGKEPGYENIAVLQDIGPMTMQSLRELQKAIKPSDTDSGDAISAVVIGIEMIAKFTRTLKYKRQLYLVTDGMGAMDGDELDQIASKINDMGIEFTVLGVDFDDAEFGFKQEDKPSIKKRNEKLLESLASKCNGGQFATIAEAIDQLDIPRIKPARPYKNYDGPLTLGDSKNESLASLSINVERYFKTKVARATPASTVVITPQLGGAGPSQSTQTLEGDGAEPMEGVEYAAVKQARTYKVNDPDAPGGKRDVEFESLAKGYEYGRTAVHISESDYNITKIMTTKAFEIIGFVAWQKYEAFLNMGETHIIIARKGDIESQLALSSLIHALHELESYAIARLVIKDDKEPQLVLLAPGIEVDVECLYDVPLPFAEDVRTYQFPPLDHVVTVNGTTLTKHRLLPTDALNTAMSNLVDAMDISTMEIGDEGETGEYAATEDSYNPLIHRVNRVVKARAIHPEEPIPETAPILLRYAAPPDDLIARIKSETERLIQVAEVKKVPPKAKGKRQRETVKPLSGLDIDALLGENKPSAPAITAENSIPDFKRALQAAEEMTEIEDAVKQLGVIIRQLATDSFGDALYSRVVENLGVMRTEMVNLEEPGFYNGFIRDLKMRLLSGELGGDRRELWWMIKITKLGLIDVTLSEVSDVTKENADEFYRSR